MKRSSIIGSLASLLAFGGPMACGGTHQPCEPGTLLDKPQLCPDKGSLGFAQEFNSGTFIGTRPVETLAIRNGGLQDLVISEPISIAGANEFKITTSYDLPDGGSGSTYPASIQGNKHLFIQVEFAPTQARLYNGTVTVKSNAENRPSPDAGCGSDWCFPVSGCGIPPDAGSAPWCLRFVRDAG